MTTILVVDDEPDIRSMVRLVLELEGYRVEEAGSGEDALERLESDIPDLMVLDIRLPGIDGWEVLDRLADRPERPEVVVISAHGASSSQEKAATAGCSFLPKPFTPQDLTSAIAKQLG